MPRRNYFTVVRCVGTSIRQLLGFRPYPKGISMTALTANIKKIDYLFNKGGPILETCLYASPTRILAHMAGISGFKKIYILNCFLLCF